MTRGSLSATPGDPGVTRDEPAVIPPVAWRVILPAALAQAAALTIGSGGYGYHRDELYYRMLPPAWGYVDQPPLVPLLARATTLLADEPGRCGFPPRSRRGCPSSSWR